ncbi:MAG: sodium:solute symporter [Cytophagaceae bacterium]|nr:sodium:solute symporter [Cytophagaceae bacterium]
MSLVDWIVLIATLGSLIAYGVWKSRRDQTMDGYLLGNRSLAWYQVGLSVMATQASAITFLSAPGQAYTDGMRFVQFYFGLPLAMIVISVTFIPMFHRLKVYTAYEFLENRFDLRTRTFTSLLFLIPRFLSTGITIYAPSLILSTLLNWNIVWTNLFMGGLVIIYTTSGGVRAVSYTHVQQMLIVFIGMALAGWMVVRLLPPEVGFTDTLRLAGKLGKLNAINWKFDLNDRYNVWSGLIGGFFLQLSYFGTDQSQVGRYISGESVGESRLGLLMNGILKIPMQFLILLVGALVFVFYQYHEPPLSFNAAERARVEQVPAYNALAEEHRQLATQKSREITALHTALERNDESTATVARNQIQATDVRIDATRSQVSDLIKKAGGDANDTNYIFLHFVINQLPVGLVGLLIAVIFVASMGSTASALNSLTSTFVVDIYRRMLRPTASERHYVQFSRGITVVWGVLCVMVAMFANRLGSMIEAVNILGSLFYGTILGIFLVAFYFKKLGATATFWAAVGAELLVVLFWRLDLMAFLWLNLLGCGLVIGLAWIIQRLLPEPDVS